MLADKLEANWNEELKKKNPSFTRAGLKTFWIRFLPMLIIFMWDEVFLRMAQALMLARVMEIFTKGDWTPDERLWACLYTAGIVAASLIYVLGHHPACYTAARLAIQIRVACCTLMYRKVCSTFFFHDP